MARQRRSRPVAEHAEIDLTPMIDVVFQLIIFFMVVTQITTQENVNLRLPDALAANPEPEDAGRLFTVHIAPVNQAGDEVRPADFGWFCYGDPGPRGIDEMRGILDAEAARIDPSCDYQGRPEGPGGISENMFVVRCDARCPAGEFGRLIELMAAVRVYKISIAILQDQRAD
jgi:hypothetical protein